jgi:hypothetical protein
VPRPWSPQTWLDTGVLVNYDAAADGRVLALLPLESETAPSRNFVTLARDFFAELERASPAQ